MVELNEHRIDNVFHALSDATRRRMLHELAAGERSVGQLAEPHAMSLAAASKHIKVLEGAGLIRREVRGRTHLCRLEASPLATAQRWLVFYEHFWTGNLDALDRLLRTQDAIGAKARATEVSAGTGAAQHIKTKTGEET